MRLHNSNFQLADLICKSLAGTLTEEEEAVLSQWKATPDNQELFDSIVDLEVVNRKFEVFEQIDSHRALAKVKANIRQQHPRANRGHMVRWLKFAAVLLLVGVAGGMYYYFNSQRHLQLVGGNEQLTEADVQDLGGDLIVPSRKKAVLVLANGEEIDLTQQDQKLIQLPGLALMNEDNLLAYPNEDAIAETEIVYNTLRVPVGGEYQVQLPDGSRVWLNSASSLRYPTKFVGARREVELHGEAYFEVKKDAKQFVVTTGEVEVKVLGTKFNVSAYMDDATIATTLVEGKVSMAADTNTSNETVLTPNKQAVYDRNNRQISVREVDAENYIAWKNGEFYFKKEKLGVILTRLSRWYDIRVKYANPALQEKEFTGLALKNKPLKHIMDLISKTAEINYRIENNTVILLEQE